MNARNALVILLPLLLWGCTAGVDVQSVVQDFDDYDENLQEVAADPDAIETLTAAREKRNEAAALLEQGKKKDALPIAQRALADARFALEVERLDASSHRAEQCRVEVEQARARWSEALFVLKQTEEFAGRKAPIRKDEPRGLPDAPALPPTTAMPDSFPPAIGAVSDQWNAWRSAASGLKVAVADLETSYRHSYAQTQAEKAREATVEQHRYLAARAVQALECRVRTQVNERVCADAARLMSQYSDARAAALAATLDLERGLQDNLRSELESLRSEARTRQDELFDALSQMEGKFASIRRDARGTIVSLADILFDFDKATLRRDVEFNLVKIATILNQFAEMNILIEGHTDSIGTEEYNLGLSERRAKAVYEFLVSQDVNPSRLNWEGYGESRPVADNSTDEGRQQNRRVDLVIQDG